MSYTSKAKERFPLHYCWILKQRNNNFGKDSTLLTRVIYHKKLVAQGFIMPRCKTLMCYSQVLGTSFHLCNHAVTLNTPSTAATALSQISRLVHCLHIKLKRAAKGKTTLLPCWCFSNRKWGQILALAGKVKVFTILSGWMLNLITGQRWVGVGPAHTRTYCIYSPPTCLTWLCQAYMIKGDTASPSSQTVEGESTTLADPQWVNPKVRSGSE